MTKSKFKCDKCGAEPEELWSFGPFGNMTDDRDYCINCFEQLSLKYEVKCLDLKEVADNLEPTGT